MKKILLLLFSIYSLLSFGKETVYTFIGKINGKFSIHMRVSVDENNNATGSYYYLSQFKPIPLEGNLKGTALTMNEYTGKHAIMEIFKGTLKGRSYSGIWIKEDGKSMPFALEQKEWIAPESDHLSGTYTIGMTAEEEKESAIPEGEHGFGGTICCMVLPNGKMGFCLSYSKGYPGYHIGELQGVAITKGSGVYEYNAQPYPDLDQKPCHILFTFKNETVEVDQQTDDSTCGFGAFVNASGTYKKENRKFGIETCIY